MAAAAPFRQLDLFAHVGGAYAQPASGRLSNAELYRIVAGRAGVPVEQVNAKSPIGRAALSSARFAGISSHCAPSA
jgi:hypothetical protein